MLPVSNSPRNNGSNRDRARSTASALRLIFAGLILPVFVYRHYIQDKGKFPAAMLEELGPAGGEKVAQE